MCEHPFNDEKMFTTEPTVPSARILSLGSKVYPCNMLSMLNKDLSRFMQSLSRIRQNRVSERKAVLLTGSQNVCESEDNKEYIISVKRSLVQAFSQTLKTGRPGSMFCHKIIRD